MATNKARNITDTTIKRLYALSGNQCAFPNCREKFVNSDNETNISNICHIEAAEQGGQRYNPNSNDDYRRSYDNLILLCANHHKVTDDVSAYSVSILREMKRNHETKVEQLLSEQNILSKYPSALSTVIGFIGKSIFEKTDTSEPIQAPAPDEKISYNNIIRFKPIIEEYAVYQGKLNRIYEEIENIGSTRKEFVLKNIKTLYLKEKGKYKTIDEIRTNADNIIESIENELWKIIEKSSNSIDLGYEVINISMQIILVDAFMRCDILEEPTK
ncbi:MAG: hypothetical protein EZS26_000831 [Candidatus Ordinivivax streblomastigis]|uniref:ABC-three component systems C-terminal domain-containing protein n=1 Tax=Candidatus Ordinivivax streblomastigis TaxID=2540710 RepID=A0A5M8P3N4_9BACT|nr:MAG: hypothetical protein EZS26_000831 [Candidatus Ordinivivax streblomastigis]